MVRFAVFFLLVLGGFAYGPIMTMINDMLPHPYGSFRDVGTSGYHPATPTVPAGGVVEAYPSVTVLIVNPTTGLLEYAPTSTVGPTVTAIPGNPVMTPNPGWVTPPAPSEVWPLPKKQP
jgi:hypothetical protein